MTHFDRLRTAPWYPTFDWVRTADAAARKINIWHEDYPRRVEKTAGVLYSLVVPPSVATSFLLTIHSIIFGDTSHGGQLREVHVIVGQHRPPAVEDVPELMRELEGAYLGKITDLEVLKDWYTDFETVHPFQDGNGRVGGVVVAVFSHYLHPDKGYLAPNQ
ncbi:hypothetical protein LCGC14_2074730 [marine sediment metagenome]|uniref:Fido domain-containing protein n=1 Tax=marine sediment metagenome TaxID=412755 RepID=A0A0F9EHK4_9ZZZZ